MRGEGRETIGLAGLRCFNIATASGAPPLLGRLSLDCIFFAHHHLSPPSHCQSWVCLRIVREGRTTVSHLQIGEWRPLN